MPHSAAMSRDGLVLVNQHTQVRTRVKYLPDGTFIVETYQDTQPILDDNARLRLDHANDNNPWGRNGRHIANIPLVIYQRLCDQLGRPSENPKGWMKWLDDIEHRKLRIWEGRL